MNKWHFLFDSVLLWGIVSQPLGEIIIILAMLIYYIASKFPDS